MTSKAGRRDPRAGMTLIEILVATSLLGLLAVGLVMALQVGAGAWQSANERLSFDRRIATANTILHSVLTGMVPIIAEQPPGAGSGVPAAPFFQGEAESMRLVSNYSITDGLRGGLQITELQTLDSDRGRRVIINQFPYRGPYSAGRFIVGYAPLSQEGRQRFEFAPIRPRGMSLVIADQLDAVGFSYLQPPRSQRDPAEWTSLWSDIQQSPLAVRITITPRDPEQARLTPITVTSRMHSRYLPDSAMPGGYPTGFTTAPVFPPGGQPGQMIPRRPYAP